MPLNFRLILTLYLVHLAVPLFFVLDVLLNWHLSGQSGRVVIAVFGLWLAVGLTMPILSRNRDRFFQRASRALLSISAVYLLVLFLEVSLRWGSGPGSKPPTLYRPGWKWTLQPDPKVLTGIRGTAVYTANELGLRGPSLPRQGNPYKVVAVGGSSTQCLYLDDSEEWPHLLMEELNRRQKQRFVWVANAGVSGKTTVDHLMLIQTLPILRQADRLILMIGANDLMVSLAFEGAPTQSVLEHDAAVFREFLPNFRKQRYPLYQRLELYGLSRKAADVVIARSGLFQFFHAYGEIDYVKFRRERAEAPLAELPNLEIGLKEFGERVLRLQEQCQSDGVRCLFLTQPSLWRSDLSKAEQKLLWFGWVGQRPKTKGYISLVDASAAIEAYNQRLLEVCRQHSLECFDLASLVPKDISAFYDDFHFNEDGARLIARFLADYLISTPPFRQEATLSVERKASD